MYGVQGGSHGNDIHSTTEITLLRARDINKDIYYKGL